MVSAVTGHRKCHVNINHYIKLEIGHKGRNSDLAVCTKLTYDSVNLLALWNGSKHNVYLVLTK